MTWIFPMALVETIGSFYSPVIRAKIFICFMPMNSQLHFTCTIVPIIMKYNFM